MSKKQKEGEAASAGRSLAPNFQCATAVVKDNPWKFNPNAWKKHTGYPETLWNLHLWKYSKRHRTRFRAICSSWPCFSRQFGLVDPKMSLSALTILWFCEVSDLFTLGINCLSPFGAVSFSQFWPSWEISLNFILVFLCKLRWKGTFLFKPMNFYCSLFPAMNKLLH